MKKILLFIFLGFILSGCATYKFQKPVSPATGGYLAYYNDKPILEYTVGKEKSLPDLTLAKERFKRRRVAVEYYYKQMNLIESRLKESFWDPAAMFVDFLGGILRWPFTAVADYKYNRNLKYKERVDRLDEEKEELEKIRVNTLKEKLAAYIAEDLNKEELYPQDVVIAAPTVVKPKIAQESLPQASALPATQKLLPEAEIPAAQKITPQASVVEPLRETKPAVIEPMAVKAVFELPVAVIVAKPVKGYSPLIVKFSGQKSYSKSGKIIAYDWNFGDGDTSTKKNPENTYWSTTFGPRNFTVTLTVKDDAGFVSSTTAIIEVSTP